MLHNMFDRLFEFDWQRSILQKKTEPTMKAKRKKSHYKRLNDYFDVYYKLRRLIQYEANSR